MENGARRRGKTFAAPAAGLANKILKMHWYRYERKEKLLCGDKNGGKLTHSLRGLFTIFEVLQRLIVFEIYFSRIWNL